MPISTRVFYNFFFRLYCESRDTGMLDSVSPGVLVYSEEEGDAEMLLDTVTYTLSFELNPGTSAETPGDIFLLLVIFIAFEWTLNFFGIYYCKTQYINSILILMGIEIDGANDDDGRFLSPRFYLSIEIKYCCCYYWYVYWGIDGWMSGKTVRHLDNRQINR